MKLVSFLAIPSESKTYHYICQLSATAMRVAANQGDTAEASCRFFFLEFSSFLKITYFLERILMEHIDVKNSSHTKLQISSLYFIRIYYRNEHILK